MFGLNFQLMFRLNFQLMFRLNFQLMFRLNFQLMFGLNFLDPMFKLILPMNICNQLKHWIQKLFSHVGTNINLTNVNC